MHDSVYDFVELVTSDGLRDGRTLEVGSLDVNGSVRPLFTGEYLGVDIVEGPGVDRVLNAHKLSEALGEASFDVVLCLEVFEHDSAPWRTARELGKVLKPGGTLIVTTRGNGFPEHNGPDLWRFMKDGMNELLRLTGCKVTRLTKDPSVSGWLAVCVKE